MLAKVVSKFVLLLVAPVFMIGVVSEVWGQVSADFDKPLRVKADGRFINVDVGHAAPFVYDFDKDGKRDLLVGQFGQGRLRIYRNIGSDIKPQYEKEQWFKAEGDLGQIPSG